MSTTRLEFHPLTYVQERDGITVGRVDAASFAVLPEDGVALLRRLADGMPLADAEQWYRRTYGESVDMADFVDAMRELGFVRAEGEPLAAPPKVRFRRLGRAAFSPLAWAAYALIIAAAAVAMVSRPELRPQAGNVFFVPSLLAVQLGLALCQSPAILWHEWYHLLAARRLGLPTRMRVGRRLYYAVVETELDALLTVPARQRYLPMLAGLLADAVLFGALVLAAAADLSGGLSWPGRLALAVAYTVLLRMSWQFYVFLRTDMYYVATTALGCTNLDEVSRAYLRDRFRWLPWVRRSDWADGDWSPRDRQLAPWFALITCAGVGVLLVTVALWTAPLIWEFGTRVCTALANGTPTGPGFWDSVASLLLVVFEIVLLPLLAGRTRRRRAATPSPAPAG
ncbi:hypothetical protein ACFY2R_04720 [Micromonospora olivasterospora]|uniref:Peptide zinc metalloprotease protein n=1 Tax=Micromonospora olivasterospora TaxID=1880 RepID=A0A562I8T4_MICOL|nr:hypothetical protein [Micromonospora olivasterospora]TWH67411.1 hypothetical protein JD77_02386 [Micromonospora olivasterospora]